MRSVLVTRTAAVPDHVRLERYRRLPELGPRLLMFSGGSGADGLARELKQYTHNSVHLVPPFDSGGSSAELRRAFAMPAIGDLRSRLLALADERVSGRPEIVRLCNHRLPTSSSRDELLDELAHVAKLNDPGQDQIEAPVRRLIANQLATFRQEMPADFDLRGASIGNLILAGGYLANQRKLDASVYLFAQLVGVLGQVLTAVPVDLHLAARLDDGRMVIGQHRITGKQCDALTCGVADTWLCKRLDDATPVQVHAPRRNRQLIESSELLVYSPGSFHSSVMAHFLPRGVGAAIAANANPKIYIPNRGADPELIGRTPMQALRQLLERLRADAGDALPSSRLISLVVCDPDQADDFPEIELEPLGIARLVTPLAAVDGYYDPAKLVPLLLSLA